MATLTVTKTYQDGDILTQADLDAFCDSIETFVNITKLNDDNIQNSGITGSSKILAGTVTADCLSAASVTEAKLADSSVSASKIDGEAATLAKFADESIEATNIEDETFAFAKVAAYLFETNDTNTDGNDATHTTNFPTSSGERFKIISLGGTPDDVTAVNSRSYVQGTYSFSPSVSRGLGSLNARITVRDPDSANLLSSYGTSVHTSLKDSGTMTLVTPALSFLCGARVDKTGNYSFVHGATLSVVPYTGTTFTDFGAATKTAEGMKGRGYVYEI